MNVYDGSQTGDVVFSSATVIGKPSDAADDRAAEAPLRDVGFAGLRHWPVTVSYFEKDGGTDDTPAYVTSYFAYANGFGSRLKIDYLKFALSGSIAHLELLPAPPC